VARDYTVFLRTTPAVRRRLPLSGGHVTRRLSPLYAAEMLAAYSPQLANVSRSTTSGGALINGIAPIVYRKLCKIA